MSNKRNLDEFFSTLKITNKELGDYVDFKKVENLVLENELKLNILNTLICNNEEEFKKRLKIIYNNSPDAFSIINLLIAERDNLDYFIYDGNNFQLSEIASNINMLFVFFKETNLLNMIINGRIKNFIDYVFGVEVGMDTNSRKNRYGQKSEKILSKMIDDAFKNSSHIKICYQHQIKDKKFDVVLENLKNYKRVFLENSFYNNGGSKISETYRSFSKVNKEISNDINKFFWVLDGKGAKTIKKLLSNSNDNDFIVNTSEIISKIKEVIE